MFDGLTARVFFEIGLGYVSAKAPAIVNEHVIPRLLAGGLRFIRFVPSITCHAASVDRDNDAAVAVELMDDDEPDIVIDAGSRAAFDACESN